MSNFPHSAAKLALAMLIFTSTAVSPAWAAGQHGGGHPESPIGQPGVPAQASRTIDVEMTDTMRFHPARLDVRKGETLRLRVKNSGQIKHELVLGTQAELQAHYEQMKRFPGMEHEDPSMVSVAPGQIGEIVWKFTETGTVDFACLQPGHFESGMVGHVAVAGGAGDASNQSASSARPTGAAHRH
ncbi:hypothetical protein GCM10007242_03840 [Pigmentiphaga litoralis]|nr:hypothetical protein GCM10007242_03840 [Pigmentiphaga litoralis]